MSDFRLVPTVSLACDLAWSAGDYLPDDGLETAVRLSLYTDRRADSGDILPDGQTDRRGYWADAFAPGDAFGSRLWLLARAPRTQATLDRARTYASEALQWLVTDQIAAAVSVTADWSGPGGALAITPTITRPGLAPTSYRYSGLWAAQGG